MKKVILGIMFYLSPILQAHQVNLSFDSLFPVSWYQKALQSSLSVWQQLADLAQGDLSNTKKVPFYHVMGRLAFTQFCLDRLMQEGFVVIDEDKNYMKMIMEKIKELVSMIIVTQDNEDFVTCVLEMITGIQKRSL